MNTAENETKEKSSVRLKIVLYISTGPKQVYYTLHKLFILDSKLIADDYVQNLCMEEDEAIAKAQAFAKRLSDAGVDCIFHGGIASGETYGKLGSNLKLEDHLKVEKIKQGLMPFGKYVDQPIKDLPQDYIYWIISKFQTSTNPVESTLAFATLAIAIDNGYTKDGEDILSCLTEYNKQISKSEYIGVQGQRLDIECTIINASAHFDDLYKQEVYRFLLKQGENLISYNGTKNLGNKGDQVSITATIKKTYESKGVKYTQITRPF